MSAIAEKAPVALSVLTELFKGLQPGERIEFVHRITHSDPANANVSRRYQLAVKVASSSGRADKVRTQTLEALATAFPGFHLAASDEALDQGEESLLPYVLQFAPAGVVVAPKPPMSHFQEKAWIQSAALAGMSSGERVVERHVWPFPGELANWALTAPFNEPLNLPATIEISVRVHGFSLDTNTCETLHKTMLRVIAGNLALFHPESPIASYSAASGLQDPAVEVIRQWLRHPSGG